MTLETTLIRFEENPKAGMVPSSFTAVDAFTTSDSTEINCSYFATDDESIMAGVWECAPCKEIIDAYPVHEMMTILSGAVTLTRSDNNQVETFTAGDTFFIAKGTPCVWEITRTLRKYYMIAA